MLKQLEVGKLYATKTSNEKRILCITKIEEQFIHFIWLDDCSQQLYGDPKHMLNNLVEVKC